MGPALAGGPATARRSASRTDSAPAVPTSTTTIAALGKNLTKTAAPTLKGLDKGKAKFQEEEEVYSDPDDGVEIIDMNKIKDMDWMAPETLREEKKPEKLKKERELEAVGACFLSIPAQIIRWPTF
jgi:DNA-directed RNA polymerase III subunit RPC4